MNGVLLEFRLDSEDRILYMLFDGMRVRGDRLKEDDFFTVLRWLVPCRDPNCVYESVYRWVINNKV